MKIAFKRIGPGGADGDVGTLWIEDGQLKSDPPEFADTFGPMTVHGIELSPSMGDRYLHGLLAKYEHGTYLRAEEVGEGDGDR